MLSHSMPHHFQDIQSGIFLSLLPNPCQSRMTDSKGFHREELHDQVIHSIVIPEDIRQSGKPTNELIAEAVAFLHRDGIVVLENAIDTAHLDTLNALLSNEALELAADPDHHFNF